MLRKPVKGKEGWTYDAGSQEKGEAVIGMHIGGV